MRKYRIYHKAHNTEQRIGISDQNLEKGEWIIKVYNRKGRVENRDKEQRLEFRKLRIENREWRIENSEQRTDNRDQR